MTEPPGFGGPSEPSGAPRTSRTRAVLFVMLGLSATGVLVGGLWAWIAPPIHAVVAITRAGERVHEYLGSESQNFFIAPFMLLGLLSVLAVVASALMWQWREHRGPQMVAGLSIGLTTAAAIAAGVGALVVRLRYGALDFDTVPLSRGDHALTYVTQAPPVFFARRPLQIALTLMWPAGIASCLRPGRRGTTWAAIRLSIRRRTLVLKPWKPLRPRCPRRVAAARRHPERTVSPVGCQRLDSSGRSSNWFKSGVTRLCARSEFAPVCAERIGQVRADGGSTSCR